MELHSKDFGSKRDYHNKRRELVNGGHVVAHSSGTMTKFHPKPHITCMMGLDDNSGPDLGWKWVVVAKKRDYLEVYQATKYQPEYDACEQAFGKVEVSGDKKTITLHLLRPCC
jgi:hypothetical protein